MPLQWRLQVLGAQMRNELGVEVTFVETDLLGLVGGQRTAALDALVRGDVLPFAILGDDLVCAGSLEAEILAPAIQRHIDSR